MELLADGSNSGTLDLIDAKSMRTSRWALVLDRLAGYVASGQPQPFFP